jgi:hypothetical protein
LTSRDLRPDQVSPNLALYRAIEEWIESCKQMLDKQQQQQQQGSGKAAAQDKDKEREREKDKARRRSIGGRRCSTDRRSSTDTACVPEAVDQAGRPQQQQQGPAVAESLQ